VGKPLRLGITNWVVFVAVLVWLNGGMNIKASRQRARETLKVCPITEAGIAITGKSQLFLNAIIAVKNSSRNPLNLIGVNTPNKTTIAFVVLPVIVFGIKSLPVAIIVPITSEVNLLIEVGIGRKSQSKLELGMATAVEFAEENERIFPFIIL